MGWCLRQVSKALAIEQTKELCRPSSCMSLCDVAIPSNNSCLQHMHMHACESHPDEIGEHLGQTLGLLVMDAILNTCQMPICSLHVLCSFIVTLLHFIVCAYPYGSCYEYYDIHSPAG